jgi:class 3 adenylate cyclase
LLYSKNVSQKLILFSKDYFLMPMADRALLEQAIAALGTQRDVLGDAVVDASIDALRKQLAELDIPPRPEQRKLVTVLFADVAGFTAISAAMDAEDVSEIMNALWALLDAVVDRFGGRIDKHIGDAVMALWGADEAREDDPVQAVLAALEMHRVVAGFSDARMRSSLAGEGQQISLRIGVHTGPVLLGKVGITHEFTAMGDTVNVASALQEAAPVGRILISSDTFRQVQGMFSLRNQPPLQVKGKVDQVQAYLVEGVKERAFSWGHDCKLPL